MVRTLPRTQFGNPILTKRAKHVSATYLKTPEFKELVGVMTRTMRAAHGVGLAAPQIGVPLHVAVMEVRPTKNRPDEKRIPLLVIINPKIISYEGKLLEKWEACLSLPKVFGKVPRALRVVVEYTTVSGDRVIEKASGLWAHIFQHEIDHLNGIRYTDRMKNATSLVAESEFRQQQAIKRAKKASR